MRSILKNKKAEFQMGWTEIIYLILGALIIFFIVTSIFGVDWAAIVKNQLPTFNTTEKNDYSLINGTDEEINIGDASAIVNKELTTTQKGVDYSRLAADVCSYLGFGAIGGVDYSDAFDNDISTGKIKEVESVDLADAAGVGVVTSAAIADSTGKIVGNLVRVSAGNYQFTNSVTKITSTATLGNYGAIKVGNEVVGFVGKLTPLKIVFTGGTSVTTAMGEDAILVATKSGGSQLISKSSSAFGFLTKTVKVAGVATSVVSVVCDLAGIFVSGYSAVQAANQFQENQKAADAVLQDQVTMINMKTEEVILEFARQKSNIEAGSSLEQTYHNLALKIENLRGIKNSLDTMYKIYSTNSDVVRDDPSKSAIASPYNNIQGPVISQITTAEYNEIVAIARRYSDKYKEIEQILYT